MAQAGSSFELLNPEEGAPSAGETVSDVAAKVGYHPCLLASSPSCMLAVMLGSRHWPLPMPAKLQASAFLTSVHSTMLISI